MKKMIGFIKSMGITLPLAMSRNHATCENVLVVRQLETSFVDPASSVAVIPPAEYSGLKGNPPRANLNKIET